MPTLSRSEWVRVTRRRPCPVCRHPRWCGVSTDGAVVCCMRVESTHPARNGGWIHRLAEPLPPVPAAPQLPEPPLIDAAAIWAAYHANTRAADVSALAGHLGVNAAALDCLGAAWAPEHRAWAFPMRDEGERVVGIRLRAEDGRKWAVRGSRSGLFIPQGLTGRGRLLICEGPTDTAAALTLGFDAIGRPSCEGSVDTLAAWLGRRRYDETVILADNDEPGLRGALKLAAALPCAHRIAVPPCKDIREWLRQGTTPAEVAGVLGAFQLQARGTAQAGNASQRMETLR